MYHSITIGDKNTWDDWHLIPTSRPIVSTPGVSEQMVSIPGVHGAIDLSDILMGYPVYGNRSGSWQFIVENGFRPWAELYSELMAYFHGKTYNVILEDEPDYYYKGRFTFGGWQSGGKYSAVTIGYNLYPFKIPVQSSSDPWLWDSFNFRTGIIQSYSDITVDGSYEATLVGTAEYAPITVTSSAAMTLTCNGNTYQIQSGTHTIYGLKLNVGTNALIFTGTGTITIDYRGGIL